MNKKFSFQKGWNQVQRKDSKAVQKKIMEALDIHTIMSWSRHLNGYIEPHVSEYEKINSIFSEYGITDIWGR